MAEFIQTMKDWRRMCDAYSNEDAASCCQGCPMSGRGCGAIYENGNADPEVIEREVQRWAAKHPEPVYPTWLEWLGVEGLVIITKSGYAFDFTKAADQIPRIYCEKLGIPPKEAKP